MILLFICEPWLRTCAHHNPTLPQRNPMATIAVSDSAHVRIKTLRRLAYGPGITATSELAEEEILAFGLTSTRSADQLMYRLGGLVGLLDFNDELTAAYSALGLLSDFNAPTYEERSANLLAHHHGRSWDVSDKAVLERQELNGFAGLAYAYPVAMRLWGLVETIRMPEITLPQVAEAARVAITGKCASS